MGFVTSPLVEEQMIRIVIVSDNNSFIGKELGVLHTSWLTAIYALRQTIQNGEN